MPNHFEIPDAAGPETIAQEQARVLPHIPTHLRPLFEAVTAGYPPHKGVSWSETPATGWFELCAMFMSFSSGEVEHVLGVLATIHLARHNGAMMKIENETVCVAYARALAGPKPGTIDSRAIGHLSGGYRIAKELARPRPPEPPALTITVDTEGEFPGAALKTWRHGRTFTAIDVERLDREQSVPTIVGHEVERGVNEGLKQLALAGYKPTVVRVDVMGPPPRRQPIGLLELAEHAGGLAKRGIEAARLMHDAALVPGESTLDALKEKAVELLTAAGDTLDAIDVADRARAAQDRGPAR